MKKRIALVMILGLTLTGCTPQGMMHNNKPNEVVVIEKPKEDVVVNQPQPTDSDKTELSLDDYIRNTFAYYGYQTPAKNTWLVKHEGNNKVAVIIKEYQGHGRPSINKLVFLWNGSSKDAKVLFVLVNNRPVYGNESYDTFSTQGDYQNNTNIVTTITEEEARKIFLSRCHAGVTITESDLIYYNGRTYYEFEAQKGNLEYEGKIDAHTGEVIEFEIDD